ASAFSAASLGGNPHCGDPVDVATGLLVLKTVDIALHSSRSSLVVERIYRTLSASSGAFGLGSQHLFNYLLDTAQPQSAQQINLISQDGSRFRFSRQSDGTFVNGYVDWLRGVVLRPTGPDTAEIRFKYGTVWGFQKASGNTAFSMQSFIRDLNGNQITITR